MEVGALPSMGRTEAKTTSWTVYQPITGPCQIIVHMNLSQNHLTWISYEPRLFFFLFLKINFETISHPAPGGEKKNSCSCAAAIFHVKETPLLHKFTKHLLISCSPRKLAIQSFMCLLLWSHDGAREHAATACQHRPRWDKDGLKPALRSRWWECAAKALCR